MDTYIYSLSSPCIPIPWKGWKRKKTTRKIRRETECTNSLTGSGWMSLRSCTYVSMYALLDSRELVPIRPKTPFFHSIVRPAFQNQVDALLFYPSSLGVDINEAYAHVPLNGKQKISQRARFSLLAPALSGLKLKVLTDPCRLPRPLALAASRVRVVIQLCTLVDLF